MPGPQDRKAAILAKLSPEERAELEKIYSNQLAVSRQVRDDVPVSPTGPQYDLAERFADAEEKMASGGGRFDYDEAMRELKALEVMAAKERGDIFAARNAMFGSNQKTWPERLQDVNAARQGVPRNRDAELDREMRLAEERMRRSREARKPNYEEAMNWMSQVGSRYGK